MKLKERFDTLFQRVKKFDYKKLVGTKAFLTVGCLVLVCVAVLVSTLLGTEKPTGSSDESNKVLGNTILVDAETNGNQNTDQNADTQPETEDFFALAVINRTQVRDSALEVLREIAQNPDSLPDAREDALASIASIAEDMTNEADIETMIKAKGISDCVAVISGDTCSVIVKTQGLDEEEVTQIVDIVYEKTGIKAQNITVVESQAQS